MSFFSGVHEVRMKRPSGIAVGYFDSWEAALQAVENEPSQYIAVWFTLNPVKLPSGIPVNPSSLGPRPAASDSDIERRTLLLIDFDSARERDPGGSTANATEAEKQSARRQAEQCREWLRSQGWPEPALCDSGNGWHLICRIALPNDDSSTSLLRGFLAALKKRFQLVDAGNFNASRVCKLYGTWARKGEHSDERPWRRSAIVEPGNDMEVSREQIQALCPPPLILTETAKTDLKLASLLGFLEHYGVAVRANPREVSGGWQVEVECPWAEEHSGESRRDTVVSFIAGRGFGFRCLHSHCVDRSWRDLRAEVGRRNPGLEPYFNRVPEMTHSDIGKRFVEEHEGFVRVYDSQNATGVWIDGKRWTLSDPGDALLRLAIRRYLDELHDRYPAPEPGKSDPRRALKQAQYVGGVLAEVKPRLPPKSAYDFDSDESILPLPDGKVADLRLGIVREMRREDCQTKRLRIVPAEIPTPRWDRFKSEITCGDVELAAFLDRIAASALTGVAFHNLIFFYGLGRNGKGVWLRLLVHILGEQVFAVTIRPSEVEYSKNNDAEKRLGGRLCGMRLAYTAETVGGNLNETLLKTLTGGDKLSGARLYCDETSFTPSHTLILATNERPRLSNTAALQGRLVFVPFNASFLGREDLSLDAVLQQEAPGILWKLIQLAPDVLKHGIKPPASVRAESADILTENDVVTPFIEEMLIEQADGFTLNSDLRAAIEKHVGTLGMYDEKKVEQLLHGVRARYKSGRVKAGRGIVGIVLKTPGTR